MERVLIVHDGECVDGIKDEVLSAYPDIPGKEKIASTDSEFFISRVLEEEVFDVVICTNAVGIPNHIFYRLAKVSKAPRRIILIHETNGVTEHPNGIEVISDIHQIK